jgi:hypothetical protein
MVAEVKPKIANEDIARKFRGLSQQERARYWAAREGGMTEAAAYSYAVGGKATTENGESHG